MLAIFLKPTRNDRYRRYWNIYHHFVGYTLLTLVAINIFKGMAILQAPKSWKHAYISLLILLSSIAFLLEVVAWVRFHLINFEFTLKHKTTHHPEPEGPAKQPQLEQERSNRASWKCTNKFSMMAKKNWRTKCINKWGCCFLFVICKVCKNKMFFPFHLLVETIINSYVSHCCFTRLSYPYRIR